MPRPKPIATQLTCAAALAAFLFGSTDHLGPKSFAALLLICALLPAAGVCLDWIRLERPRFDDAFFAAATIAGAAVVGLAPSGVTALWHPVLLVVALTFALRRTVVAGAIVDRDATHLTLALERGRLRVDRDAHEALGGRSPLVLDEGAPLALTTRIGEEQRGEGPFRSARILSHGPIIAVGATPGELRRRRRSHLLVAVGMVLASAAIGWGVALVHLPMIGAPVGCPHSF